MRFRPNMRNINAFMREAKTGDLVKDTARNVERGAGPGQWRTDSQLGPRRWRAAVIGNYDKQNDAAGTRRALLRGMSGA